MAGDEVLEILKEMRAEIKALKSQSEQANARIADLEKQLEQERRQKSQPAQISAESKPATVATAAANTPPANPKPEEKQPVLVGDLKGTIKIPGTDTSVGIGGHAKVDALFNSVSAGRDKLGDQQTVYSQIPVGNAPGEHNQLTIIAKDTRLWFKSFTPTLYGDVNTYAEFDFYGDPAIGTYAARLRHGYGSLGNFMTGQTWTTFLNTSAIADHIDTGNSAGSIFHLRQPMIRWTQPFTWQGVPMDVQFALESPRTRVWVPGSTENLANTSTTDPNIDNYFITPNADRYPDLIARLNFNPTWANISLAALGRQVRYTNASNSRGGTSAWGGDISLAGKIGTFELDNFRFMLHYGNGASRYIGTNNTFEDAAIAADGRMELVQTYGGMISYQHWWNKQWRSNVTYGYVRADQPYWVPGILNRQVQSIHANLLWSPISQTMFGVEYVFAERELINGLSGDLKRVQFSARYSF
ncbi:MAG: DcaP family trimeric outer membrane transporter [Methylobacter sp.]